MFHIFQILTCGPLKNLHSTLLYDIVESNVNSVMNSLKMLSIQKSIAHEILLSVLLSHYISSRVHTIGSSPLKNFFLSVNLDIHSYNSARNEAKKISYWSVKIFFYNQDSTTRWGFLFSWSSNPHSFNLFQSLISFFDGFHIHISLKQIHDATTKPNVGLIWSKLGLIYTTHQKNP